MFWRITKIESLDIGTRLYRFEGFIKRTFGMCIEIVANKRDRLTVNIPSVQHAMAARMGCEQLRAPNQLSSVACGR